MSNQTLLRTLRSLLASLYPEESSARRLVADAELDTSRITFSGQAINTWHAILSEAVKTERLQPLLDCVLAEYGANAAFQTVYNTYMEYTAAGGRFTWPLPTLDGEEPPAPGESPYKGLQYFDTADAALFFGRERLTAELVAYLRSHRFLAVVGASGSGKSSLVRAGVVPALQQEQPLVGGVLPPDGSVRWHYCIITPTAHPPEELAAKLTQNSESVTATATLLDDLGQDTRSLHLFVRRLVASDNRLLLVVDQFEELFTLCRDANERKAFVDNLLTAAGDDGMTTVIITLRADFYAHCFAFDNLRAALEGYQKTIGLMNQDELRQAIEKPAQQAGWDFEPGLVDLLLHDVGDEPGALPLLSHALLETWKRRRGRTLTLAGYVESGRVQGAIAQTAERVYKQALTPEQQVIAKNIFLRLTELGEGAEDTRRRVTLHELMPRPEQKATVERVLNALANARLITTTKDEVEVAHEALIRRWPTLREWLQDDREGLRIHRRLTEAAQGWEALKRDPGELYRGLRLQQVQTWAGEHGEALNELEQTFLSASLAERQQAIEAQERIQREREEARQRDLENAQALATAAEQQRQSETARAQAEAARAQEAEARQQIEQQRAVDAELAASRLRRRALYLGIALAAAIVAIVATTYFYLESSNNASEAAQNATEAENNAQVAEARITQFGEVVGGLGMDRLLAIGEDLVQAGDKNGALILLQTAFGSNPDLLSAIQVDALEIDTLALLVSAIDSAQSNLTQRGDAIAAQTLFEARRQFIYRDRNGATYLYIPAGEFLMGSGENYSLAGSDERPQHTVILDGYWIQSTEVTKAQYRRCMEEGPCNEPGDVQLNNAVYVNHPIVAVDWFQARTYAEWVGGRLPSEAEWEKACRGTEAGIYPWGDESPTAALGNFDGNVGATTEVGSYPEGASPYGLYDMAGNVWEWTADWYDANYYETSPARNPTGPAEGTFRTVRGSWNHGEDFVRCASRHYNFPDFFFDTYGFRVVVSSPGF